MNKLYKINSLLLNFLAAEKIPGFSKVYFYNQKIGTLIGFKR